MSIDSYYLNNKVDFDRLQTNDTYVDYQQALYSDEYQEQDDYLGNTNYQLTKPNFIMKKHKRRVFLNEIENWFNQPLYVNNDENQNESITNQHQPTNRDFTKSLYNDILNTVEKAGYIISDLNQFKEDISYFIYRLSQTNS